MESKLLQIIERYKSDTFFFGPVAEENIIKAERALGLTFPSEYREFIKMFGSGVICEARVLGVEGDQGASVVVTRSLFPASFDKSLVVIEYSHDYTMCMDTSKNDESVYTYNWYIRQPQLRYLSFHEYFIDTYYRQQYERALTALLLVISDELLPLLQTNKEYNYAVEAIDEFWYWHKEKSVKAGDLYSIIESDDAVNLVDLLDSERNATMEQVWLYLCYALALISKQAYVFENRKHVPQSLEGDREYMISFIDDTLKVLFGDDGEFFGKCKEFVDSYYRNQEIVDEDTIRNYVKSIFPIVAFHT